MERLSQGCTACLYQTWLCHTPITSAFIWCAPAGHTGTSPGHKTLPPSGTLLSTPKESRSLAAGTKAPGWVPQPALPPASCTATAGTGYLPRDKASTRLLPEIDTWTFRPRSCKQTVRGSAHGHGCASQQPQNFTCHLRPSGAAG